MPRGIPPSFENNYIVYTVEPSCNGQVAFTFCGPDPDPACGLGQYAQENPPGTPPAAGAWQTVHKPNAPSGPCTAASANLPQSTTYRVRVCMPDATPLPPSAYTPIDPYTWVVNVGNGNSVIIVMTDTPITGGHGPAGESAVVHAQHTADKAQATADAAMALAKRSWGVAFWALYKALNISLKK